MEILLDAGIRIDNFKLHDCEDIELFCLSHCHLDHVRPDMRKFPHMIHCSYLATEMILHNDNMIVVEPGEWYTVNKIKFYVLETIHCPGSIGFYFPKCDILYLGDTRITTGILKTVATLKPRNILYDNTHQKFKGMFPSLDSSACVLLQAINEKSKNGKKKVYVCIPHVGAVLLLQMLDLKVQLDDSLKPMVAKLVQTMDLEDKKSKVVIVGMKFKKIQIMPSSQYFVINKLDPHKVVDVDGNLTRVFASFHAGESEIHLLSKYNLISLNFNED